MKPISTQELTTKIGATRYAVEAVIKHLKLQPIYQVPQGKGTIDIWDEEVVLQPVMDELRKREKVPPAQATLPLAASPDLEPLINQIKTLTHAADLTLLEISETTEQTNASLKKLCDQNVVLLRMLEDIRANAYAKIDALQATIDGLPDLIRGLLPQPPVVVSEPVLLVTPPPKEAPAQPLKRVAIIALMPDQKALIEREFGKAMDLRVYSAEEARGNGSNLNTRLSNCDAVFLMNNFTDRTVHDHVKKAGIKPIVVTGGMTRLRDALTDLYMQPA